MPLNELSQNDVINLALPKFSGINLPAAPVVSSNPFDDFEDFVSAPVIPTTTPP